MNIEAQARGARQSPLDMLLRNLQRYEPVSEDDLRPLDAAFTETRLFRAGQELVGAGDRPDGGWFLLEGWTANGRILTDGSRQIVMFHIPGDFVDLHSFLLHRPDYAVMALTPCRVAHLSYDRLRAILAEHPRLGRLLWLATLIDDARVRNRIVTLGRMPALSRMAHLFCELYTRLEDIELARDFTCDLPLTHTMIADALGLSIVHVSRTLKQLRERKLITWRAGLLNIRSWDELTALAHFNSAPPMHI